MYNTTIINQELRIDFKNECMLTCMSQCVMSTEFISTTGSRNPNKSPWLLSIVWNVLLTSLLDISNAVDMQSAVFETAAA